MQISREDMIAAAVRLSEAKGIRVLIEDPLGQPRDDPGVDYSGVYELLAYSWDEPYIVLTPHPVTGVLVEVERTARHVKGDLVKVGNLEARRLLAAGAIATPGEREEQELKRIERAAKQAAVLVEAARSRIVEKKAELENAKSAVEEFQTADSSQVGLVDKTDDAAGAT
jgi:hypothetical protein